MSIKIDAIIRILQSPNGSKVINSLAKSGITGTSGNDTLTGTQENDLISGDAGNDVLLGGDGNDVLNGGADDDQLLGGTGNDILLGGIGNDVLDGGEGSDQLRGNQGDDIYLIDENDIITENENEGEDTVIINNPMSYYALGINFENLIHQYGSNFHGVGNTSDNKLFGNSGNDYLEGLDGNDTLIGLDGDDYLDGGNGNDLLNGGAGQDILMGGDGDDTYIINDTLDEIIELENGGIDTIRTSLAFYALPENVENLIFSVDGNFFEGHGNILNNTIESNAETSLLFGYEGEDTLLGGIGNDFLTGGEGDDEMHGGLGDDTLVYIDHEVSVDVDLVRGTSTSTYGNDRFSGMENIIGGSDADRLTGDGGRNSIYGGAGNDIIFGGGGDDYLSGDDGADQLSGGSGNDQLIGGSGDDILFADAGDDELNGGSGTDTVSFINTASSVNANLRTRSASSADGNDTLIDIENIHGSNYDDFLMGDAFNNLLVGEAGNDTLDGYEGDDTLIGNSGDDTFTDWLGINSLFGGEGGDTVSYASFSSDFLVSPIVNIDLSANFSNIESYGFVYIPGWSPDVRTMYSMNSLNSIENATGSNYVDFIFGNPENNQLYGLGGNDLILGGFGDDVINGGDGIDTVSFKYLGLNHSAVVSLILFSSDVFDDFGYKLESDKIFEIENVLGGFGNDQIWGNDLNNHLDGSFGSDTLYGLGGDDTLIGGPGGDYLDGGDGDDTVDYRFATESLVGNLAFQGINSGNDADILISIENIIASEFDDQLVGNNKNNRIEGRNGDDFLYGLDGNDTLIGDNGDDQLYGGTGNDWLIDVEGSNIFDGGLGIDTADFSTATSNISASLTQGFAMNISNNATFIFSSTLVSIENLVGSRFDDILEGNNQNNVINGGLGSDTASYNNTSSDHSVEANLLTGQASVKDRNSSVNDVDILISIENLIGSSGNDILIGNDQDNVLIGGDGADSLIGGAGNDVIYAEVKKDLVIDGGEGIDTLHIVFSSSSTELLSNSFFLDGRSGFTNFENLVGSEASEYLSGDFNDNQIDGGLGNDHIDGRGGNDILKGGDGINIVIGGSGHNVIDGSASLNSNSMTVATYTISESLVIDLRLERGNAALASIDTASFTLIDDYINIFAVSSGDGNDLISGNGQNNILRGNSGDDQIFGLGGDDVLDGGLGFDILEGGIGSDIFVFKNYRLPSSDSRSDIDTILDFGFGGSDKIDVRSFGTLNVDNFQIINTANWTNVYIEGTNFTQRIVVEGPLGGSLTLNDFLITGFSNPQTNAFDSYTNFFSL